MKWYAFDWTRRPLDSDRCGQPIVRSWLLQCNSPKGSAAPGSHLGVRERRAAYNPLGEVDMQGTVVGVFKQEASNVVIAVAFVLIA